MFECRVAAEGAILVVEDEPLLRLMAVDLVEAAGYDVLDCADADEAIRIIESRPDIRVVFTDIDMPGSMNGMKLAAAIRRRWPPIGLILTSGHYERADVELPARGLFFPKPYLGSEVIDALRRMAA